MVDRIPIHLQSSLRTSRHPPSMSIQSNLFVHTMAVDANDEAVNSAYHSLPPNVQGIFCTTALGTDPHAHR